MRYKIKYHYQTGDSFNTYEHTDYLDYYWDDLDIAKEALRRIEEHYPWARRFSRRHDGDYSTAPSWWKVDGDRFWALENLINIPVTADKEVQFYCPWLGYFEYLHYAEIVPDDTGMRITF